MNGKNAKKKLINRLKTKIIKDQARLIQRESYKMAIGIIKKLSFWKRLKILLNKMDFISYGRD